MSTPGMDAAGANREYYEDPSPGLDDYWRLMAAPRHRMWTVLRMLRRWSPSSIVDLGCGSGVVLEEIDDRMPGLRLAGIDLADPRIAANKRRRADIEWLAANLDGAAALPPAWLGAFDVVVAMEIVEHLE